MVYTTSSAVYGAYTCTLSIIEYQVSICVHLSYAYSAYTRIDIAIMIDVVIIVVIVIAVSYTHLTLPTNREV